MVRLVRFFAPFAMTEEQKVLLVQYGFADYALSVDSFNQSARALRTDAEQRLSVMGWSPCYDTVRHLYRCRIPGEE